MEYVWKLPKMVTVVPSRVQARRLQAKSGGFMISSSASFEFGFPHMG